MLALDLSLSSTGWALFTNNKLAFSGSIQPPVKLSNDQKIYFIASAVKKMLVKNQDVAVEDTYFMRSRVTAFKELNRLAGAIIYLVEDITKKDICFYQAVKAREAVGLNTKASKYDLQTWVIKKHFPDINIKKYEKEAIDIRKQYVTRKITESSYEYQLEKLSKHLGKDVGKTNDEADAIILGEAHIKIHTK